MISLVYPYYDNPMMFQVQQLHWNKLWNLKSLHGKFEVLVTDDASPKHPAKDFMVQDIRFPFKLFRIKKNVRWNWIAAKNVGAHEAAGSWLCLTDMDHMWLGNTLENLMIMVEKGDADPNVLYTFERLDAPNFTHYKYHPNTYFISRDLFWKIGGYDEDFSGYYGTDGYWRKRALQVAKGLTHLKDLYVLRYPREVIADASTTEYLRKTEFDKEKKPLMAAKLKLNKPIKSMTFEYERLK